MTGGTLDQSAIEHSAFDDTDYFQLRLALNR